ncbi:hypothetical protein IGI04_022916 [Brassica rapa subsp. trilocularis]|uniref:RNase H type-1 domain-containing protein n=1 Tax=Brassica rapa subsp. trilocularis TaxID=1813537 RepID=A0ABQ7M4H8_BRACM|nr:hypothetical protein IGI04_022916 [Brassica rapa subsp. trilocularis]
MKHYLEVGTCFLETLNNNREKTIVERETEVTSLLQAEALAAPSALLDAKKLGFFKICIKSDCQVLLVKATSSSSIRLISTKSPRTLKLFFLSGH